MKNLKIGTKLLLTFMIIIALFCGTVYVATSGLRQCSDKYGVLSGRISDHTEGDEHAPWAADRRQGSYIYDN